MKSGIALVIAMVALGTGCASTRLLTDWRNPSYAGDVPKKVLVVAAIPSTALRNQVEEEVAKQLSEKGIQAVPMNRVEPSGEAITREAVDKAVTEGGFDGLLQSRYLGTTAQTSFYPSRYGYAGFPGWYGGPGWHGGWFGGPGWFGRGPRWGYVDTIYREQLETSLFDTEKSNRPLIWTATSTTALSGSGGTAVSPKDLSHYARVIVDRMLRDLASRG